MGDLTNNLSMSEFACPCGECGINIVDLDLPTIIQDTRDHFNDQSIHTDIGIHINSGSRCKAHNKKVGGAANSQHLYLGAADFYLYDKVTGTRIDPDKVYEYLDDEFPNSLGLGKYKGRTHVDNRYDKAYRWDMT